MEKCSVQGVSFIISILLARLLMPEEYGIVALVVIFTNIANVIVEGGFSTALIQKKGADNIDFSTVLFFSLFISSVLYIILFVSSPYIASFYNMAELTPIIRILNITLFFGAINSVQTAYVAKNMLFNRLFKCSLISSILSGCIGIGLAYKGFGVWALVYQRLLSSILTTTTMLIWVKWRPILTFSKERFKSLFDFGLKIFTSNMMISLFMNIRSLLIGKFFTPTALAYFDKGRYFPSLIMDNINTSIQTILLPVLSEQQDDVIKVKSMLRRSIKTSSLFIFPLLIGFTICAEPFVKLLLTDKWLFTVPFIQIFSISYILMPIQIANVEAIKALGHSKTILKLETFKKILEVSILIISFFFGVIGISWGVVVYNAICLFVNTYPCKRLLGYGYKEQFYDILPTLISASLMGLCIYCFTYIPNLSTEPLLILTTQIIFGILIYIILCYFFKIEGFMYVYLTIKNILTKNTNKTTELK